jgi:6,7-dimethyl-8-ribityllumazine synthase
MAGTAPRRPERKPRPGGRFGVLVSRFHETISKKLLDGALETFRAHGVNGADVEVQWVPGAFELPQAALGWAKSGRFAALICLGVVIKGETPHFEHVAREAAAGISRVALTTGIPAAFGVITALTPEQAWARAGGAVGNRGEEAALAALEMAEFMRAIRGAERGTRNRRKRR